MTKSIKGIAVAGEVWSNPQGNVASQQVLAGLKGRWHAVKTTCLLVIQKYSQSVCVLKYSSCACKNTNAVDFIFCT